MDAMSDMFISLAKISAVIAILYVVGFFIIAALTKKRPHAWNGLSKALVRGALLSVISVLFFLVAEIMR
jgi:succinate dehydrogenase hydrophobic anchor subunit